MTDTTDLPRHEEKKVHAIARPHVHASRLVTLFLVVMIVCLWVGVAIASASDVVPGPAEPAPVPGGDALTALPLGVVIVSFVMTGLGYVVNYVLPGIQSEQVKGALQWLYQAIGVVIYQIAFGDGFGLNKQTLVAFIVALGAYAFSHNLLYKPPGWNVSLGGGRNRDAEHPKQP